MRPLFYRYLDHPILREGHPLQKWLILLVILFITETAMFASVGVNIATPDIQSYYDLGITETDWITTAFLMMLATTVPISARVGVQYGFKFSFFIGCAVFFFANLCVCFTDSYSLLIVWRLIAGAGAGILMPQSISILAFTFDKKTLPLALSLYTAVGFGGGFAFGSMMGGFFSQDHPFQWIFFIIFFIGIVTLAGICLFFRETQTRKVSPFDMPGYLSFLAMIFTALLLTMNAKAPWNTQGWYSFYTISHAAVLIASFVAFLYFELTSEYPLFLLKHFTIRAFFLASIGMFLIGGLVFGTPVFFSQVLHDDLLWANIQVGNHFAMFGLAMGISGALTGILSGYTGIRWPSAIGLILITLSCFMNHNFTIYSTHVDLYIILIVRGMGVGIALGPVTSLGLSRIPSESKLEIAKATVMLTILRQMGAAFSSNILGIVITQRQTFHAARFSDMINPQSAAYQKVYTNLYAAFTSVLGSSKNGAEERSFQEIVSLVMRQAHVAAFDDAFFGAGIIVATMTAILIFLMIRRYILLRLSQSPKK